MHNRPGQTAHNRENTIPAGSVHKSIATRVSSVLKLKQPLRNSSRFRPRSDLSCSQSTWIAAPRPSLLPTAQRDRCSNATSTFEKRGKSTEYSSNTGYGTKRIVVLSPFHANTQIPFIELKDILSGEIVENVYKCISTVRHIETFYWPNGDIYFYYCCKLVAIKYKTRVRILCNK